MNHGFTLIELLAVIVILAIISLIATPIVLNIIENVRTQTQQRSIELYAHAIENTLVSSQLNGSSLCENYTLLNNILTCDDDSTINIEVNVSNVSSSSGIVTITNGEIKVSNLVVNGIISDYGLDKKFKEMMNASNLDKYSWAEIREALLVLKGDNLYSMVGKTKKITLNNYDEYTDENNPLIVTNRVSKKEFIVRIANVKTPEECSRENFSETACGFVFEFDGIINKHVMNPAGEYGGVMYSKGTNVGGFPASETHRYLSENIYDALPDDLKAVIIDTYVVSSHGSTSGEENHGTIEKLYLLSAHEVFTDDEDNTIRSLDSSYDFTRQLDIYEKNNISTTNYEFVKKSNGRSYGTMWTRSARLSNNHNILHISDQGYLTYSSAYNIRGISPAFRIG